MDPADWERATAVYLPLIAAIIARLLNGPRPILMFASFHGMEEVTGSIPVRSTNQFKHLAPPPFRDFVAFLSQIPKPYLKPIPDSSSPRPQSAPLLWLSSSRRPPD